MFWKFRWMLFLPLFLPAWGQPAPEFWKPAPRSSHLEILSPLGGWQTAGTAEIRLKLTDPTESSKAKTYLCTIQPEDQFMTSHNFADCNSDTAFYCLKPGTARTLEIQGTIQ